MQVYNVYLLVKENDRYLASAWDKMQSVEGKTSRPVEDLRVTNAMERDRKVKIQPPHLIVLFSQNKPQMPVVKQRGDPFFGCKLQGEGHSTESLAIGLLKDLFSVLLLWGIQSLTSVKVSENLLSTALSSSPPISYSSDYPQTPCKLFLTAVKHAPVNLHPHFLETNGFSRLRPDQYMCIFPL